MSEASGFTRLSLGRRLERELDEKAGRGEIVWYTGTRGDRLMYVIEPGVMWADPKPPRLYLTPGECADWCGIEVKS